MVALLVLEVISLVLEKMESRKEVQLKEFKDVCISGKSVITYLSICLLFVLALPLLGKAVLELLIRQRILFLLLLPTGEQEVDYPNIQKTFRRCATRKGQYNLLPETTLLGRGRPAQCT